MRRIAELVEDLPEPLAIHLTSANFYYPKTFRFVGGDERNASSHASFVTLGSMLTTRSFPRLAIDPNPDGFTQFVIVSTAQGGRFALHRDTPQASRWLPTLMEKILMDYISAHHDDPREEANQADVTPSIVMRPITNEAGQICAYFVSPIEFSNWESIKIARGLELTNPFSTGYIDEPQDFIRHFHDDEGRFFLPIELSRFSLSKIIAFWLFCSLIFDTRQHLGTIENIIQREIAAIEARAEAEVRPEAIALVDARLEELADVRARIGAEFDLEDIPFPARRVRPPINEELDDEEKVALGVGIASSTLVLGGLALAIWGLVTIVRNNS